jgi:opacity protein-like surface antigen
MRKTVFLLLLFLSGVPVAATAQGNDLALVVGAKFTPSTSSALGGSTSIDTRLGFEGSFAFQLKGLPLAALQLEVPVMVTPSATVNTSNLLASKNYTSLYFTPGFRLKFAPGGPISPWIAVGAGLVRFTPSTTSVSGGASPATSTVKGAGDAGAGVDIKVSFLPIRFRIEAREYFSGSPNLNIPQLSLHNNIFAGGGIALTF